MSTIARCNPSSPKSAGRVPQCSGRLEKRIEVLHSIISSPSNKRSDLPLRSLTPLPADSHEPASMRKFEQVSIAPPIVNALERLIGIEICRVQAVTKMHATMPLQSWAAYCSEPTCQWPPIIGVVEFELNQRRLRRASAGNV